MFRSAVFHRKSLKALAIGIVLTQFGRKNLDRNVPVKARVAGAVHLAQTAFAEQRHDFVGTQASACFECH